MQETSDRLVFGEAIPSITRWGHTADADLIYRALLMLGPRPAGELARTLGLSPRRVSVALHELSAVDAVSIRVEPGRRETRWVARPPSTLLESLRSTRRPGPASTAAVRPAAGSAGPTAAVLASDGRLGDGLAHLPSRAAARRRLAELAQATRHEHLAMNTEIVFDAPSARSAVPVDRTLLDRGVRMRVLGRQNPDEPDPLIHHGRSPDEHRPDYRQAQLVPMKLIVVDRRIALFPVAPHDFARGYLEVSQAPVVAALVGLFEREWDAAQPRQEGHMPQIILDDRERALVTLLARGHTDATAARELHVSPRTVSNILRSLMDRVGVENRFQLGLALGAARAVPPGAPPGRPGTAEPLAGAS
jgi:DNA-binding CsgD family transcriptional regulator/DNA-binding transcriptional ArsR family regulator